MPLTYFGPYNEQNSNYANAGNANLGRWPLGHTLVLPDGREYKFALNDGTVEVAGYLYQGVAPVTGHTNRAVTTAAAIGATAITASITTTVAGTDIYAEGAVHVNDATGEGYSYRIRRAMSAGTAHASAASTAALTVNLDSGESLQVALDTTSEVTFSRNRYHAVTIHPSPPTALLAGVSPGVAAASRFYWSQVKGYASVYANLTLLAGLPVMADLAVDGAITSAKRTVTPSGTTALLLTNNMAVLYLNDQDGTTTGLGMVCTTTRTAAVTDITGGIAANAPIVGECIVANASTEFALVDLRIN